MSAPGIRLVIADSHEVVREGIANRLESGCPARVLGHADNGYAAIKLCRQLNPDVLLMDLSLSRPSGPEVIKKLRDCVPDLAIVVMSSDSAEIDAFRVLGLGAVCFIPKQAKGSDFVNAISAAAAGFTCIPSHYIAGFVKLNRNVSRSGNVFGLTPREIEVLEACASGRRTKEVAHQFNISVRTVETHRNSIYRKTNCYDMRELFRDIMTDDAPSEQPSSDLRDIARSAG